MPIQLINQGPGFGARLGESFGGGLGTGFGESFSKGLQQLASDLLSQIQQQRQQERTRTGLRSLGFNDQESHALSQLPEPFVKEILKRGIPIGESSGVERFSQAQKYLESPEEINLQESKLPQQRSRLEQLLTAKESSDPLAFMKSLQETSIPEVEQFEPQPIKRKQILTPKQQKQVESTKEKQRIRELLSKPYESPELKLRRELAEKKAAQQERIEGFKQTKELRKDINQKAQAARQSLHDLDRMEELQKEGKLDTPGYVAFLERSGFDIPALMEPGSEEFNKIAQNFTRFAKDYYGSRVTNNELNQFLRTIPSLSQSPEGRKRVIANLKYINRGALEYSNILKEIIKENSGIPPLDLAEQIDDRIGNKLGRLSEQFKKDLLKPVPEGQNKLITALQASAGSVLGSLGKGGGLKGAAKGAVYGAGLGTAIPGLGTIPGAVLGGLGGLTGIL